jgi:hypothetical protein
MPKCKAVKFAFYTGSVFNKTPCISCYKSNHVITAVVFGRSLRNVSRLLLHPENHNNIQISNIGRNLRAVHMGFVVDKMILKSSLWAVHWYSPTSVSFHYWCAFICYVIGGWCNEPVWDRSKEESHSCNLNKITLRCGIEIFIAVEVLNTKVDLIGFSDSLRLWFLRRGCVHFSTW